MEKAGVNAEHWMERQRVLMLVSLSLFFCGGEARGERGGDIRIHGHGGGNF